MTDHLRDSIDQNFPPEPPDDPRPDPAPPPDDLAPCPVCGGNNLIAAYYSWSMRHFIRCNGCHIDFAVSMTPPVARSTYQRLARAVALLRAVERLESALRHEVDAVGLYRNGWRIRGVYNWPEGAVADTDSAADALIALAAQLEARDG